MADQTSLGTPSLPERGGYLSKQQIFDTVLERLRAQGGPVINENGNVACRYRYNGRGCSVGVLIPDNDYDPAYDDVSDTGVDSLVISNTKFEKALQRQGIRTRDQETLDFLLELQRAHDGADGFSVSPVSAQELCERLESRFEAVAAKHGLTYKGPQQ